MDRTTVKVEEKGVEEKEAGETGQDDTAEKMEVTSEMKPLTSQVDQVFCGGKAAVFGILPVEVKIRGAH